MQIKKNVDAPYSVVFKWRLEQEHEMKARNGGRGLNDEQVRRYVWRSQAILSSHIRGRLVDRFIPAYVFFGDSVTGNPSWRGRGLVVTVGENRQVLGVEHL